MAKATDADESICTLDETLFILWAVIITRQFLDRIFLNLNGVKNFTNSAKLEIRINFYLVQLFFFNFDQLACITIVSKIIFFSLKNNKSYTTFSISLRLIFCSTGKTNLKETFVLKLKLLKKLLQSKLENYREIYRN